MLATTGTVSVTALELRTSRDAAVTMASGLVPTTLRAEFWEALLSTLAGISRHDKIHPLHVAEPTQLFEERGIIWIVPSFANV